MQETGGAGGWLRHPSRAPPGKRTGRAGAIVSGNTGTAQSKVAAFEAAGVRLANLTLEFPGLVKQALAG